MKEKNKIDKRLTPKGKKSKGMILDMAEKIFMEDGYVATKMTDIVKKMGISLGAIYHHFPSKKSLLLGIAERSINNIFRQMESWMNDESLSPSEKMHRFLLAYHDRLKLKINLERIKVVKALPDAEVNDMVIKTGLKPITEGIKQFIEEGNKTGEFTVSDPKATAFIIFIMMFNGLHNSGDFKRLHPEADLMDTIQESVERLLMWKNPKQ